MTPHEPAHITPRAHDIRLLLVEDNAADAMLVQERVAEVTEPRVEVVHVRRLDHALQRLAANGYDVVLLDLGLPDSQGLDSVRRIQRAQPELPVVVLTGLDSDQTATLAVREGAQDFLVKGAFEGQAVVKSVVYAIERARVAAQIRGIVDGNVDAMVVVGRDGRVRYVNDAATRLLGQTKAELLDSPFPYSFDDGGAIDIDVPATKRGAARVAQMRVASVEWDGEPAALASIRDVTQLRHTQELERRLLHADRLASIGQLAAGVAHEINNPAAFVANNLEVLEGHIAVIRSATEALRQQLEAQHTAAAAEENAEVERLLRDALDEAGDITRECRIGIERIADVVKDLSGFSRIQSDDASLVDLNEVVEAASRMASIEIRHRATLIKKLAPVPSFAANEARLTQAVLNLLINAAHAINAGSAQDNLVTVDTALRGRTIVVGVEDTGSGIDAHDLPHIFEPFYTTKPSDLGTGLGLAIATETVRAHGGELTVRSTPGAGTRFEIILPTNATPAGPRTTPPTPAPTPPIRSATPRVLIIDDDTLVRRAMRRVLEPTCAVVEVPSGEAGLEVLARDPSFDLVICDLMMPGLDGVGVYERLQESAPDLLSRLVFATGGACTPRAHTFLASTHATVLDKPIASQTLRDLVRRSAAQEQE